MSLFALFKEHLSRSYSNSAVQLICKTVFSEIQEFSGIDFWHDTLAELTEAQQQKVYEIIDNMDNGFPLAYVVQNQIFYGEKFRLSPAVLIPRPETEELVDLIVQEHKADFDLSVLDIGTGSGCIAVTLNKHLEKSEVYAWEKSNDAITIAKANAKELKAEIKWINHDFLDWQSISSSLPQFDMIVSNPPYISADEEKFMDQSVVKYEPKMALFPENNDHLIFYKEIILFCKQHLSPKGHLYLELNEYAADKIVYLYEQTGFSTQLLFDLNKKPRMLHAKFKS